MCVCGGGVQMKRILCSISRFHSANRTTGIDRRSSDEGRQNRTVQNGKLDDRTEKSNLGEKDVDKCRKLKEAVLNRQLRFPFNYNARETVCIQKSA